MKKLLWLIFINLIFVGSINAKVYYSDYSEFSPFQEEKIYITDTIDVIEEERYLWYKDKEVLKDYQLYNSIDKFSNECYFTDYSPWMIEKIENEGYIYDERNKYIYTLSMGVRYIHLYNLQGSYGSFRMTELDVKYNNNSIDYTYICDGCWGEFDEHIHNGIYEENKSYISNGGNLIIDLGKTYPINLIDVIFYIFDLGESEKLYTIGYSIDKKNIFANKNYNLDFSDEYLKNAVKRIHNVKELNKKDWQYEEETYELKNNEYILDTTIKKEYRYKEKWCKIYNYEKEYSDYSKEQVGDYINRVDESLKKFYSYRTREKLELNIKPITEKNFDLNNFIIDSSGDVLIESNINWSKNGVYDVQYQVNDFIVNEKIKLDIESNTVEELISDIKKEYENKIKDLEKKLNSCNNDKEYLEELNNLIKHYENKMIDYQNKLVNLNNLNNSHLKQIRELENDISNLNNEILQINKNKNTVEENKLDYILKINKFDIKYIIFILLLLLSYFIGKRSNKK